jgi:site-specific DNA-cytosine methylase
VGRPIVIDLFCGLGGWTEGFLAEGYDCVGYDIERHETRNQSLETS